MPTTLNSAQLSAVIGLETKYGFPIESLLNTIMVETGGTFSPAVANRAGSGAVGLIQFTRDTARALNTSTTALQGMDFLQQLHYVDSYLFTAKNRDRVREALDVYLLIFYPNAVGQDDNFVIANPGSIVWLQNKGMIAGAFRAITRGDVKKWFNSQVVSLKKNSSLPIAVITAARLKSWLPVLAALIALWYAWKNG